MKEKMADGAFGRARNYGRDGRFQLPTNQRSQKITCSRYKLLFPKTPGGSIMKGLFSVPLNSGTIRLLLPPGETLRICKTAERNKTWLTMRKPETLNNKMQFLYLYTIRVMRWNACKPVCVRAFVRACDRTNVCVCACVYIRVRTCVRAYGRTCVRAYVRANVRTCVCVRASTFACVRSYVRANVRTCVCVCVRLHSRAYVRALIRDGGHEVEYL